MAKSTPSVYCIDQFKPDLDIYEQNQEIGHQMLKMKVFEECFMSVLVRTGFFDGCVGFYRRHSHDRYSLFAVCSVR